MENRMSDKKQTVQPCSKLVLTILVLAIVFLEGLAAYDFVSDVYKRQLHGRYGQNAGKRRFFKRG